MVFGVPPWPCVIMAWLTVGVSAHEVLGDGEGPELGCREEGGGAVRGCGLDDACVGIDEELDDAEMAFRGCHEARHVSQPSVVKACMTSMRAWMRSLPMPRCPRWAAARSAV